MKWSGDAEKALKKVPFFVRKKVKKKVEAFAAEKGKTSVELTDVDELKAEFLSRGGMEKHIKGYEVAVCFGSSGCPNPANSCTMLAQDIEDIMIEQDLLSFLKKSVSGDLKFHHEFRIVLSDCPNACSRPQIADIGIIGASVPALSEETCSLCRACVEICDEKAVLLIKGDDIPVIDHDKCLMCKKCINACPTGTIFEGEKGFRVFLGGRLGRHPRLAMEMPGLYTHDQVLDIVKKSIKFYKKNSKNGQRFSHILPSVDVIAT